MTLVDAKSSAVLNPEKSGDKLYLPAGQDIHI
jgi:hypothetical protein